MTFPRLAEDPLFRAVLDRHQAAQAAEAAEAADAAEQAEQSEPAEKCIGYGCSPEQDTEINEGERLANDDYGPGCDYQLCGSDLPENDPDYQPRSLDPSTPATTGPHRVQRPRG